MGFRNFERPVASFTKYTNFDGTETNYTQVMNTKRTFLSSMNRNSLDPRSKSPMLTRRPLMKINNQIKMFKIPKSRFLQNQAKN